MRIGLDWRPTYEGRGGIPVYVRALTSALLRRFPDDRFLLYAHQARGRSPRRADRAARTGPAPARLHATFLPSRAADALARVGVGADLLVGGCDVLHLTGYSVLRTTRAAVVATVHDVLFEEIPRCFTAGMRRGLRDVTRRVVRVAARLLVPSARTKSGLVERFGADPARIDVIPLAPRTLPSVPRSTPPRPTFLAVGTLEPRKNLLRVLEAFSRARARDADLELVVVGARGWLDDDLVAAAATAAGVRVEGAVDDARLAALYAGATALLYPSLGEGFGLPVVEAMAAGLPVVTSAGTACADVARGAALLVEPTDVDAIRGAIERVASDAALRERLAAAGRVRAAELTWDATADATRASYAAAAGA